MSTGADVRSLDQMQALRERCQTTRVQMLRETENLQLELQNMANWIHNEAETYWQGELKVAARVLRESKEALAQCESYVRESEKRPCTEQKKQFARASERYAICERKVRLVREAQQLWEQNTSKLHSRVMRVRELAESDLVVAIQKLDGLLGVLETYTQLRSQSSASAERSPPAPLVVEPHSSKSPEPK